MLIVTVVDEKRVTNCVMLRGAESKASRKYRTKMHTKTIASTTTAAPASAIVSIIMFKLFVAFALVAIASAYSATRGQVRMSLGAKFSKFMGVAAVGLSLASPLNLPSVAHADGAVSKSTVYRARNSYGARIYDLRDAADKADFAAFEDKRIVNAFDLFISGSNALNSQVDKERKAAEKSIQANLYAAVKAKDANKLRAAYNDFVKVADLKPEYKPGELGQTDSSGYAPTWGTDRQYIYQR